MSKLLFISTTLIAVVLVFYWLNTTSAVNNRAVGQTENSLLPKIEKDAIGTIALSLKSAELDQMQEPYPEGKDPAGSIRINKNLVIDADDYNYQQHQNELINVGQVKDADISLYQRDDSEVINVGEVLDVDMPNPTY